MDLAGDEKKIQALFSELSFEDQRRTPRFEKLWPGAEVKRSASRFDRSLVFVMAAVLLIVAGMLAAWSRFISVQTPVDHQVQKQTPQQIVTPPTSEREKLATLPRRQRSHPNRHRSLARLKQSSPTLQEQAASLQNWQSPTATFLASPLASSFNSLPQLNQSAKDLESFLPKNSQSMKESNQ
jgi:hypothetical protein